MHLTVDFAALQRSAGDGLGSSQRDAGRWAERYALEVMRTRLSTGTGFSTRQLQSKGAVLGLHGMQVFLYNPDQGQHIDQVLLEGKARESLHLARCSLVTRMLDAAGPVSLRAANNLSANVSVYGFSGDTGRINEGSVELGVCKHCLDLLNYKGYGTQSQQRERIAEEFTVAECFARYSTLFDLCSFPAPVDAGAARARVGDDAYRRQRGDTCECCEVGLRLHRQLLCTHHLNGDVDDCRVQNLRVLCLDCQRKEAGDRYRSVRREDMRVIQQCRRAQGLLEGADWGRVIALADAAFDGLLRRYREQARSVPQIDFALTGVGLAATVNIELAWPEQKRAVSADMHTARQLAALGWHCLTLEEALTEMDPR